MAVKTELSEHLTGITESILKKKGLHVIFNKIMRSACSSFDASASSIMVFDRNKEYLTIACSHNLSPEYRKAVKVGKDEEIAGKVCQKGKTRFVSDVQSLYEKTGDRAAVRRLKKEGLVSLVCAPLLLGGEPIGCINVYYRSHQGSFKERRTLEFLATLAALSVEHSKFTQQRDGKVKKVKLLDEVGLLLTSSHDFDELVMVALSTAILITQTDVSSLILIDEMNNRILDAYEYNKGAEVPKKYKSTARLTKGISGKVLTTRKPVIVTDLKEYSNVNPVSMKKGRVSVVAVPLIARERMIGILYANSFSKRDFAHDELNYLSILCNQAAVALDNTMLYDEISREAKETSILYETTQSLISTLDFDELLNNILKQLKNTFGYLNLEIFLMDEGKQALYARASGSSADAERVSFKIDKQTIIGHVAATRKMYHCPDVSKDSHYTSDIEDIRSEICFPLLIGADLIGVIDIGSNKINGFTAKDINLLSLLSTQIAIVLENSRLYEKTKKLSLTDPLTTLPNRRNFEMFVEIEIKRSIRYHRPFSVLMIDIDNFKEYNDQLGHLDGDEALQTCGRLMQETVRDVDFLGRYGGDEFIAVLPETDTTFAAEVAERINSKIAKQSFKVKLTLSIGIAAFPKDSGNKIGLIELADQACYKAKERGGNCVHLTSKEKE